jgi:hypothetical protein
MDKDEWIQYTLINAGTKFRNKKKFWYGIPAYTGPFRELQVGDTAVCVATPISRIIQRDITFIARENVQSQQNIMMMIGKGESGKT